ncbi:spore coat U domain-containing protein [Halomonas kalidii]|uniref:Spore coat U domain-containing protein n=1 Tax=Halomonas kalidii TaxID=3043293 RepID=A0ABT6VU70_9GAMM|nr:spore coat U domain-containing protein [Halomonas kalidii]MDI5936321.1 spore coat U domain-containing protein [Halomonas kalidii]
MSIKTCSLRKLTLASTVALGAGWGAMAQAQTATANLDVSTTVVASCTIGTTALAFGDYDPISPSDLDSTGTVTVTCTQDAPVAITLGQGANPGGTSTDAAPERRLSDGTNFLTYSLFSDSARTTVWTNEATGDVETTGTGAAEDHTVFGRVDGGQSSAPAGTYTDTVVATVTF